MALYSIYLSLTFTTDRQGIWQKTHIKETGLQAISVTVSSTVKTVAVLYKPNQALATLVIALTLSKVSVCVREKGGET